MGYSGRLLLDVARFELLLEGVNGLAHLGAGLFYLSPASCHLIALAGTLLCFLARRGSGLWRAFVLFFLWATFS
jgi:hypothetical protein